MNEDERWELRFFLLWQEGLVCSLCKAAELVTPQEVQAGVCDECSQDLEKIMQEMYAR